MLADSHAHLASHRFSPDEIPGLLERARNNGVKRIITLATRLGDLDANLAIAGSHAMVSACIGIHPCDVHEAPDDATTHLARHTANPLVCGIGETGLDYFHPAPDGWGEETFRQRQRDFLEQHFQLAAAANLNLVIHTRDRSGYASFEDALAIYQNHHQRVRALFHCFIGPWENAGRVIRLGGLVSFGGVATFKNAGDVRDTAARCPAGSFVLETDSPYLAPEPHRGQRNEPAYVKHVADRLADLRGEALATLCEHTGNTLHAFFRLAARES
jgi:TatD DNase family protein